MSDHLILFEFCKKEVTVDQYNDIVHFLDGFAEKYGNDSIKCFIDEAPLRLSGKLRRLTSRAREYFANWHSSGTIRNISIVKSTNNEKY